MTKYITVQPKGPDFCVLRTATSEDELAEPFESWALRSGQQILYVNNRMAGDLKAFHMTGSYDRGAMYAYSYDDMVAVLTSKLGPSDRARYEAALLAMTADKGAYREMSQSRHRTFHVVAGTGDLVLRVFVESSKFLLKMLLLPFFISWIGRKRD